MVHCVKRVRFQNYSGPHFPTFELSISPYSAQMRENADQNNSKYGHFLRSGEDGNKLIVNSYFASRYIYGP